MRVLLRRQIDESVTVEWPAMARGDATLTVVPVALDRALRLALTLTPRTEGQKTAQREIVASVQATFDARRQRIILSESSVNWVKWTGVILVGVFTLLAIAFVQSGNRHAAAIALVALRLRDGVLPGADRIPRQALQRAVPDPSRPAPGSPPCNG